MGSKERDRGSPGQMFVYPSGEPEPDAGYFVSSCPRAPASIARVSLNGAEAAFQVMWEDYKKWERQGDLPTGSSVLLHGHDPLPPSPPVAENSP
jgi:hypothetical protein